MTLPPIRHRFVRKTDIAPVFVRQYRVPAGIASSPRHFPHPNTASISAAEIGCLLTGGRVFMPSGAFALA